MANTQGVWVKLDEETKKRYCHEVEGEAWSLARGASDIIYLQHEADLTEIDAAVKPFSFSSPSPTKGFDFTTAQHTPSFSTFGSAAQGKNEYQIYSSLFRRLLMHIFVLSKGLYLHCS